MNFYHWHYDVLPVLNFIEEAGISIQQIDNILVPENLSAFQSAMLSGLGVTTDQLVPVTSQFSDIECEYLFLPVIRNQMGMKQSSRHYSWLRKKYVRMNSDTLDAGHSKILIERESRGFTNSEEVRDYFKAMGFTPVYMEKMRYEAQVQLVRGSSVVVAPHGAALSLLAYCRPGTVVHEFYGDHVHPCFWSICSSNSLKYYNYNCGNISDSAVTNSGKGLGARLNAPIAIDLASLSQEHFQPG